MIFLDGASGGLGRHVAGLLAGAGAAHHVLRTRIEGVDTLGAELGEVDLGDDDPVAFIHLAAMVSVPACEADPALARRINVDGAARYAARFLEWCGDRPAVVLYTSTGHVYAPPRRGVPLAEDAPLEPRSVYAATKLEGERAVAEVADRYRAPLLVARVFGLLAPGQAGHYVLPSLIDRVRRGDLAAVPGLSNVRDYLDARDVAAHLVALASPTSHPSRHTTVNVCSGVGISIAELLRLVIETVHAGDPATAAAAIDTVGEAPSRPSDVPWLVGSPAKLRELIGRPPRSITLATTVRDAVAAA